MRTARSTRRSVTGFDERPHGPVARPRRIDPVDPERCGSRRVTSDYAREVGPRKLAPLGQTDGDRFRFGRRGARSPLFKMKTRPTQRDAGQTPYLRRRSSTSMHRTRRGRPHLSFEQPHSRCGTPADRPQHHCWLHLRHASSGIAPRGWCPHSCIQWTRSTCCPQSSAAGCGDRSHPARAHVSVQEQDDLAGQVWQCEVSCRGSAMIPLDCRVPGPALRTGTSSCSRHSSVPSTDPSTHASTWKSDDACIANESRQPSSASRSLNVGMTTETCIRLEA